MSIIYLDSHNFCARTKFIHDKIHGIFGDKDDKYKEMADNLFINGIMDEKEYTSVINKKEKNRDDFER